MGPTTKEWRTMQTMADSAGAQASPADEHVIVMASTGAGYTVIEALRPKDGLLLWYYDTDQSLGDFVAGNGVVFLSTSTAALAGASAPPGSRRCGRPTAPCSGVEGRNTSDARHAGCSGEPGYPYS
jgi:hypothetical protein